MSKENTFMTSLQHLETYIRSETTNREHASNIQINKTKTQTANKFQKRNFKRKKSIQNKEVTGEVEEKMTCFRCNRKGHSATNCIAKSILIVKNAKFGKFYKSFILPISINEKGKSHVIEMEYDTAATGSVISLKVAKNLGLTLLPSSTYISGVTDEFINCSGKTKIFVTNIGPIEINKEIEIQVAEINYNILGIPDICCLGLDQISLRDLGDKICIKKLKNIDDDDEQERKLAREYFMTNAPITFPNLFSETAGRLPCTVSLKFIENPQFRHIPLRPYGANIKEEVVEQKIQQYVSEGKWIPTNYALATSPLKPIEKRLSNDQSIDSIRFTADFSSLNKNLAKNFYPMKNIYNEIRKIEKLRKSNEPFCCSQFDIKGAYETLPMDRKSAEACGIITHIGVYIPTCVPQGVALSPGLFQEQMDRIVQIIESKAKSLKNFNSIIIAYSDDITIVSYGLWHLLDMLSLVCDVLNSNNLRLCKNKTTLFQNTIKLLGYVVTQFGITSDPEKIQRLLSLEFPKTKDMMKSFCGSLTYHQSFIPYLAQARKPLDKITQKNAVYEPSDDVISAFTKCRNMLANLCTVRFYNGKDRLILESDASEDAIGSILLAKDDSNREWIISIHSRGLTKVEQVFPIQHKEALGIYTAVQKHHKYLCGRTFTIRTDHRTLLSIFGEKDEIRPSTARRLQRFELELLQYSFTIEYRKGSELGLVDVMSRTILNKKDDLIQESTNIHKIVSINEANLHDLSNKFMTITPDALEKAYEEDIEIQQLIDHILVGKDCPKAYRKVMSDLNFENNICLFGQRIIIPSSLRTAILKSLHSTHNCSRLMKLDARRTIYWPSINADIDLFVTLCKDCDLNRKANAAAELSEWKDPTYPFEILHSDIGMCYNHYIIACQDQFSGYMFAKAATSHTVEDIIAFFIPYFQIFGLPKSIITDGGHEYRKFGRLCDRFNIQHITSPVENPSSNGMSERLIQTIKSKLEKMQTTSETLAQNLFLIQQTLSTTPRGSRELSPNELIFKFPIRTLFDAQLHKQAPPPTKESTYKENQRIFFRKNKKGKWSHGTIIKCVGSKCYEVRPDSMSTYASSGVIKLHENQIREEKSILAGSSVKA